MSSESPGKVMWLILLVAGAIGIAIPPLLFVAILVGLWMFFIKKKN
jgi:hypothetical protein